MLFLEFLSIAFGYIYTLCWSLSFYPQMLLNYRRRSTSGTTVDFPLINCLGACGIPYNGTRAKPLLRVTKRSGRGLAQLT